MVNEDILGGLKTALFHGASIKDAMFSFYNAGYKKEEVEEAAKTLQNQLRQNVQLQNNLENYKKNSGFLGLKKLIGKSPEKSYPSPQLKSPIPGGFKKLPQKQSSEKPSSPKTEFKIPLSRRISLLSQSRDKIDKPKRTISEYEKKETPIRNVTIVLIFLLLLLFGALWSIIIFREQIIKFLNQFF